MARRPAPCRSTYGRHPVPRRLTGVPRWPDTVVMARDFLTRAVASLQSIPPKTRTDTEPPPPPGPPDESRTDPACRATTRSQPPDSV